MKMNNFGLKTLKTRDREESLSETPLPLWIRHWVEKIQIRAMFPTENVIFLYRKYNV